MSLFGVLLFILIFFWFSASQSSGGATSPTLLANPSAFLVDSDFDGPDPLLG